MFREINQSTAFIATLGLQPQVVTRGLDKLLALEPDISYGIIIYTGAYRSHPEWATFELFQRHIEQTYETIKWEWVPIKEANADSPLNDVNTPDAAELAFKIIYNQTKKLKQKGYRLHTLLAGGRKSIIVYAMITAQLLFDTQDKLWHIFSEDEYQRNLSVRPHVPLAITQLLEIPIMHLAGLMPMVRELILHSDDPTKAIDLYRHHDDVEWQMQLQMFFNACEPIDQMIMWLRFRNYSNSEVAQRVHLTEPGIIRHLHKVADHFLDDPALRLRYPRGFKRPNRDILIALRPVLLQMETPPPFNE